MVCLCPVHNRLGNTDKIVAPFQVVLLLTHANHVIIARTVETTERIPIWTSHPGLSAVIMPEHITQPNTVRSKPGWTLTRSRPRWFCFCLEGQICSPGGSSNTILQVMDAEVLGWQSGLQSWATVGCTAKFSVTTLVNASGSETIFKFKQTYRSCGWSCKTHSICMLP